MASLYKQSVPIFIKYLINLSKTLRMGVNFADEKGMSYDKMFGSRLFEDMKPLSWQVQACCNTAKFFVARIGAIEARKWEDDETTFEQLQERITDTIEYLRNADEAKVNGAADKELIMVSGDRKYRFETGQDYFSQFSLANFHFHFATTYCILRNIGVPVGATDYLGADTFVKAESA